MANNYSQGTVFPFLPLTQPNKDLLDWQAEDSVLDSDGEWINGDPNNPEDAARAELDRVANALDMHDEYYCRPEYEVFQRDPSKYYVFCENGLDDVGARVLQHILKDLDPEEYPKLVVEGAYYCSKLRPGEFGGWACVIWRDRIEWGGTQAWIEEVTRPTPYHWDEVPGFPSEDWQYEVANGDTRLGYREWCSQQQENKENDSE